MASCSRDVKDPISYLEKLEDYWNSVPPMKEAIHRLKVMLSILIPFVRCSSMWQTESKILKVHLKPIASVLENLIQDFRLLSMDAHWRSWRAAEKLLLSNLERLRLVEPQVKEIYSALSKYTKSITRKSSGEDVVSFISLLLENLKDILSYEVVDDVVVLVNEQIQSLEEKLRFLRNFLCFVMKRCTEHYNLKDLFTYARAMAIKAACLLYFCVVGNQIDNILDLKAEVIDLLRKIKPVNLEIKLIYARALRDSRPLKQDAQMVDEFDLGFVDSLVDELRDLLENNPNFMVADTDPRGILLEELRFLRYNLLDPPLRASSCKELNALMIHTEALIIVAGQFIFFGAESSKQNLLLPNMLEKIKHIKEEAKDCYDELIPKEWQSNFPKTNELGFIDFILKNLKERRHYKIASIDLLTSQTETIHEELVALREDFTEMAELCNENERLRCLFIRYKDVAYQVEYFVDLTISGEVSLHCQKLVHFNLREDIRHIQKEIKSIKDDFIVQTVAKRLHPVSSEASHPSVDTARGSGSEMRNKRGAAPNLLVGLEKEAKKIIEQLTRGSTQLKILSIVGMPGIGKTTMSNFVYDDPSVTLFFHVRGWCSVSQAYRRETLLIEILHQTTGQSNQSLEMDANYFAEEVYRSLKGKKYLIVIDDIWTIDAWNDMKESFPDDNNGSRILFTTRDHSVALQASSVPHALRLLTKEESWKLLKAKVFKEETCPLELLEVGKKIAKNCKGLPLSVVLIAGLLKMTQKTQNCWEEVAQRSRSHVIGNPRKQQFRILELSYKLLPDYLKPCFLYFVSFPEDTEIPVSKLVQLWIAEGFVQGPKANQNRPEKEAEKYLNDLIDRSLVRVAKRSSRGGIKACSIHDLLRDFCLIKAQEERFLLQILNKDHAISTFEDSELGEQYRLCIYSNRIPSVRMGHIESRVRTLLFRKSSDIYHNSYSTGWSEQLNGIDVLFKFRLLRVLDLEAVNNEAENVFFNVILLDHLRYLAVMAYTREIPSEIANLKKLETFILKGTIGKVVLPWSIWNMTSLRHIHMSKDAAMLFPWQNHISEFLRKGTELDSLKTISTLELCHDNDIVEKMMRKLPNLQKLRCIFSDSNYFPKLDFLSHLESLKMSSVGKMQFQHPFELSFPSNLKKLTLSEFGLPWEAISIIGGLPNLEVLKLHNRAFKGPQWDMKEGEFQKLKFLKLELLDIERWIASDEHLPILEQLVLHRCVQLEEIPSAFGEISTLRVIKIYWCKRSAMDSVREIKEQQYEMGNELHAFSYESREFLSAIDRKM